MTEIFRGFWLTAEAMAKPKVREWAWAESSHYRLHLLFQ